MLSSSGSNSLGGRQADGQAVRPVISVVTVTYNCADAIVPTLRSVAAQTYEKIEYLIIDGCSTDATVGMIKKHSDLVSFWCSEQDSGIYDAMNKGANLAHGEWLYFLNAGDELLDENLIERVACKIIDGVDLLYGDYIEVFEGFEVNRITPDVIGSLHLLFGMPLCHQATLVRTSVFRKLGGFDLNFKLCADQDFISRLLKAGHRAAKIDEVVCRYDTTGVTATRRLAVLRERQSIYLKNGGIDHFLGLFFLLRAARALILQTLARLRILKFYRLLKFKFGGYR